MPIALIALVLAVYGYEEGKLYLGEAVALVLIWIVLLVVVWKLGVSLFWFYGPCAGLSIYSIIRVLGANAEAILRRLR